MKVFEVYDILNKIAPFSNQCDFDNAGFLVGDKNAEISSIVLSLDCTKKTIEFAKESGANLIITHHPIVFEPLKSITDDNIVYSLLKNDISVISAHTNLDFSDGGINDTLCDLLGFKNIKKFNEYLPNVFELRIGEVEEAAPEDYAKKLKSIFNIPIKYVSGNRNIKRVAVCSGSGGSFVNQAILNGADALVTSDIKHSQFLTADYLGLSLYDCGHFNTEDIIIEPLLKKLKAKVNLEIFAYHGDEIKYC